MREKQGRRIPLCEFMFAVPRILIERNAMNGRLSDFIKTYSTGTDGALSSMEYGGLFIEAHGSPPDQCILVLSGTSIQLADIEFFINCLVGEGYSVASIERDIGGLIDFKTDSKADRKLALGDFIDHLKRDRGVSNIYIIAQSYAALEVVRLLVEAPETYRASIPAVVFVNPAGFDRQMRYLPHCFRFLFIHVLSGYASAVAKLVMNRRNAPETRRDFRRKLTAVHSFFIKTVRNPIRTFKEIADIVSFDIIPYVKLLIEKYGFSFHFVLNGDDNLVSASRTLEWVRRLVPHENVTVFPGNHLDFFVDERQIVSFLDTLGMIAVRGRHA